MFAEANEILKSKILEYFPDARKSGKKYSAKNPLRNDQSMGSFFIDIDNAFYIDFADDQYKGDLVDLYAKINNIDNTTAARKLTGKNINEGHYNRGEKINIEPYEKYKGLPLKNKWFFNDKNGKPVFCVVRYSDGEHKSDLPFHLEYKNNQINWKCGKPPILPLYNLDKIYSFEHDILLVEGQKCAEIADKNISDMVVTAWYGGVNQIESTDLSPLVGRTVYFWADNDQAGRSIINKLLEKNINIKIVQQVSGKPKGWDIADAINEGLNIKEIIYKVIEKPIKINSFALGYDSENYYFRSMRTDHIMRIKMSNMTKNSVRCLASDIWFDQFRSEGRMNWDKAIDYLMGEADKAGSFSIDEVRGIGMWHDRSQRIFFDGENIHTQNEVVNYKEFKTRNIYEKAKKIDVDFSKTASDEDLKLIRSFFEALPIHNMFELSCFIGWVTLAPFCGWLKWKPHIWLSGESGSGKSYIQNWVDDLLGDFLKRFSGETTSAGITQNLKCSILPIMLDEAEPNTEKNRRQIDAIFSLLRNASSIGNAKTAKGTADHKGMNTNFKSMAFLASISEAFEQTADRNRFTSINLGEHKKTASEIEHILMRIKLTGAWKRYIATVFHNFDVILNNITVFGNAFNERFKSARFGEQLGTLYAGGFYLFFPIKQNNVSDIVSGLNVGDIDEISTKKDHHDLLQCIFALRLRYNQEDVSVYEAIKEGTAIKELKRCGIDHDEFFVYIGINVIDLKDKMNKTNFARGFGKILKRHPLAMPESPQKRFNGQVSRCVVFKKSDIL